MRDETYVLRLVVSNLRSGVISNEIASLEETGTNDSDLRVQGGTREGIQGELEERFARFPD
jgi:hypothetical protein